MSKRYGRNQKQAHRERIAELEGQVETLIGWERAKAAERRKLEAALAAQRRETDKLVEEIRNVCLYSALLPAEALDLDGEGPWRLAVSEGRLRTRWVAFNESLTEPMMVSTVDIHEVGACLDQNLATFQRIVHVRLPGRTAIRYAVSREAMAAFGRNGLRQIAEHLMSSILAALNEPEKKL